MVWDATSLRVLVVEDDADNAESLALLLRLWGHDVAICRTAAEALKVAPGYAPHAVLLDIGLPGMDGWEVARQIRRQGQALMIGISGFSREQDLQRARQEGLDHFLVKPAEPEHLERLLREAARGPTERPAPPAERRVLAVERAEPAAGRAEG